MIVNDGWEFSSADKTVKIFSGANLDSAIQYVVSNGWFIVVGGLQFEGCLQNGINSIDVDYEL